MTKRCSCASARIDWAEFADEFMAALFQNDSSEYLVGRDNLLTSLLSRHPAIARFPAAHALQFQRNRVPFHARLVAGEGHAKGIVNVPLCGMDAAIPLAAWKPPRRQARGRFRLAKNNCECPPWRNARRPPPILGHEPLTMLSSAPTVKLFLFSKCRKKRCGLCFYIYRDYYSTPIT